MPEHDPVVAHRRASTPAGPDYCEPCSQTAGDWVQWEGHLEPELDARARLGEWRRAQGRAGNRIGVAEEIAWLCAQLDGCHGFAKPPPDLADLTQRIAVVLASGGPVEDEQDAAEQVVEMMLTAGDLPA